MTERDAKIDPALRVIQRAIVKHPLAAQAIYSALVREGLAYAQTDEGAELRAQLTTSETAARVRTAWELLTVGMLDHEAPPGALPSVLVQAFVDAVFRARFETRLRAALSDEERDHATRG